MHACFTWWVYWKEEYGVVHVYESMSVKPLAGCLVWDSCTRTYIHSSLFLSPDSALKWCTVSPQQPPPVLCPYMGIHYYSDCLTRLLPSLAYEVSLGLLEQSYTQVYCYVVDTVAVPWGVYFRVFCLGELCVYVYCVYPGTCKQAQEDVGVLYMDACKLAGVWRP